MWIKSIDSFIVTIWFKWDFLSKDILKNIVDNCNPLIYQKHFIQEDNRWNCEHCDNNFEKIRDLIHHLAKIHNFGTMLHCHKCDFSSFDRRKNKKIDIKKKKSIKQSKAEILKCSWFFILYENQNWFKRPKPYKYFKYIFF